MKISDVCKEFFTGFNDLHAAVKTDDAKTFVSGALKVCAYCTFILPAVVAFAYAADVIVRQYHLDQKALELGQKISDAALPHFQQFGKKIEEKAEIARAEVFAFARARYQDVINFKDELMGKSNSSDVRPPICPRLGIEDEIPILLETNYSAEPDLQSQRLAYILGVLESQEYNDDPSGYVHKWIEKRGATEVFRCVEDVALDYFKRKHRIQN